MRFVGITHDAKSRRIVISQPDIQGRPASWEEIDEWFADQGFAKLRIQRLGAYDSAAFAGHGVGVFDVRPINVVMTDAETLLPIDVMIRAITKRQMKRHLSSACPPKFIEEEFNALTFLVHNNVELPHATPRTRPDQPARPQQRSLLSQCLVCREEIAS